MKSAAVWWLTVSILLSAGSLHFYFKRKFIPAGAMLLASLVGMVVIRHYVRLFRLQEYLEPTPIIPQWSVFTIFIICLLVAVAFLIYMIRMFLSETSGIERRNAQ